MNKFFAIFHYRALTVLFTLLSPGSAVISSTACLLVWRQSAIQLQLICTPPASILAWNDN